MKNTGFSKLRLVAPANTNDEITRARAIHAADVWENRTVFETLPDAIADCALVIGTTRRRGRERKAITVTARELALYLKENFFSGEAGGKIAIVFGNERTGLTTDELALCNIASHIPSDNVFPSLNLSHAVQIYCYELFLALDDNAQKARRGKWEALERSDVDALVKSIGDSLAAIGFYKHPGREAQEESFRDIFCRAGLTRDEARYLKNIFSKIAHLNQ
jgi:tRNA/rRNA methyltransferase/tRNA (cytidine32/uridine32-2'-O)-methyltransferase